MTAAPPDGATGPLPLVVVPGMLCDRDLWSGVAFPEQHPVRHVGLTRADVGRLAEDVLSAVTGPFVLVGLSLGAIVGFEVLRRAPERIAGFCAMATNAGAPRPEQYAAWRAMDGLIAEGRFTEAVERTLPGMFHTPDPPDELAARYRDMAHRVGPDAARAQLAAQATRTDAYGALRTVRCPVSVLYGTRDALCPPDFHRAIADAVPGARLTAVPGAGHLLPMERPGPVSAAVNALLRAAERGRARPSVPLRPAASPPSPAC
ncbi:alpha/beta hydrolase [Streptomyces sp. Ru73]|uniref:alpha/beta fold hydrolase n=1 Tax=Streptomyces sp. Ru73 TaxID=2080748 RepID=UPI000CDE29F6|nr:alpha/beta fold hydrolase [Streptomyces sp. Ru73]POX36879.1 alpha/beta hydrolase [Streptomyces sp. Ru73]